MPLTANNRDGQTAQIGDTARVSGPPPSSSVGGRKRAAPGSGRDPAGRLHIRYVDDERTHTLNLLTFKGGLRGFHKCSRVKGTVRQRGETCSTPVGLALGRGVAWLAPTVTESAQQRNISTLQNPKCRHGPAKTNKSLSLYVWMKQTGYSLMSSSCSYSDSVTVGQSQASFTLSYAN